MKIETLILGAFQSNSYIVRANESLDQCIIIDSGPGALELVNFIQEKNLNPLAVILTHGHIDHIAGLEQVKQSFEDIEIFIHRLDADMLGNPEMNLSAMTGEDFAYRAEVIIVEQADFIEKAGISLKVLHTPGHTPGGICLYAQSQGVLFSGDTLFADSVGRTDFSGGSMAQLIAGIKDKLFVLPDGTIVYPGHGPATTIGRERKFNQYLI